MALLLGIDTGGTYTDAVLMDQDARAPGIIAKSKALTTHDNLAVGIEGAINAVTRDTDPAAIGMVSISTTLATNALVESKGGDICLLLIGFDEGALDRAGLRDALAGNPHAIIAGGHGANGVRQAPLDKDALRAAAVNARDVEGFAIVAHFGSRDPVDEIAARDLIRDETGLPVTCGHELSAELGGPKRALTAVLNARLIGMIDGLILAVQDTMTQTGIDAPLMIVRGDGSLVSADFARKRPIETILSGPAASLVGAAHLTGRADAVVSDIGGTTTDIAVMQHGRPLISPRGAAVGGHLTMVEAVAMTTSGLGGDSEVRVDETVMTPRVLLGPRRVVPLSRLAVETPEVIAALDAQIASPLPGPHDGVFVLRTGRAPRGDGLRKLDRALLDRLGPVPVPAASVLRSQLDRSALNRLIAAGLAMKAGFTPTDAAHVLGDHTVWDLRAAELGAALMARRRTAAGQPVANGAQAVSRLVRDAVIRRSAEAVLAAVWAHDGLPARTVATDPVVAAALDGHQGVARVDLGLALPLVGLGAGAPLYYPGIAEMLGCEAVLPDAADVANAVGAVAGGVRLSFQAVLTQPSEGLIRVHLPDRVSDHPTLSAARDMASWALREHSTVAARDAGADAPELTEFWEERVATVENRKVFIEATLTVTATGRPRVAGGGA